MIVEKNIDLKPFNTFGVSAVAKLFCRISTVDKLRELIASPEYRDHSTIMLGEGSNILLTKDFEGLAIKMEIKGISIEDESDDRVIITVTAGESWHEFVMYCVNKDFGGLENLSLIPGTCGAAPIQNIGAYGVEIKDLIKSVACIDASSGELKTFSNSECRFGYRESVFKHEFRKKYFISSITLTLTKKKHNFNVSYGALKETLHRDGVVDERDLTIKKISDAVISIRRQKLPDVKVIGSAGSFFKNPSVNEEAFNGLQLKYPKIPHYQSVNQTVKLAAGWLIEQCGWKGKRYDDVGVHEAQALVLVNYGNGTGKQILNLSNNIRESVFEKFGVMLETEVNII